MARTNVAFDHDTGQMYTEAQVRVNSRHHSDWIGELKTPSLARKFRETDYRGVRSLAATATTQVAYQFRELSAEHFATVPWPLGRNIWSQILTTRRESFHTWRVFATAYPNEMATTAHRYYLHIRQPSLPLDSYFSGITSVTLSWSTCLRISPKETRIADLVAVSSITNLAMLDLSDGQIAIDPKTSSFDERVMRTWAEIAEQRKGFLHLQVIMLGWQDIDAWIFKYLPYFPALSQVIVTDSQRLTQRDRKEWEPASRAAGYEARHAKKSAKSLRPVLDDLNFQRCAISGLLFQNNSEHTEAAGSCYNPIPAQRPTLECWIGTPRRWAHILEDFPGNRTIFFDRTSRVEPESNTLHASPKPNVEALKRGRHLQPKFSRMDKPRSDRTSHSRPKSRKVIPGLAGMLDDLT